MKIDKEIKIPVRIMKVNKMPKRIIQFISNPFLKKIGNFVLIAFIISSQVFLLSAFEAHVVNVTAHICGFSETRTMGYWKNHPNVYNPNCLPQNLGSELISSVSEVNEVFKAANANIMIDMLKGQLLAMKFNICAFGIDPYEGEEFEGRTLAQVVDWADSLLMDPNSTREEQELTKNLLDYANNLHQIRYCSVQPLWLNASLSKKLDKTEPSDEELTASLETVLFIEEPLGSEPPAEELPAPEDEPPAEEPPAEEPPAPAEEPPAPAEEPPAEEPLGSEPPAEEPPAPEDEPPAEEPPAEEPPAEEPPAEEPPAPEDEPPAEEPPAEEPPAEEPPAEEPPAEEPSLPDPEPEI